MLLVQFTISQIDFFFVLLFLILLFSFFLLFLLHVLHILVPELVVKHVIDLI